MSVSPSVLGTYLAAAARQALEGAELSARSHWAIAHARKQLKTNHDVIAEKEVFLASLSSVGVHKLKSEEEPDLAEIVLNVNRGDATGRDIVTRREQATAELRNVLDDLQALSDGENTATAKEAAQHLLDIFGTHSQDAAA